MVYNKDIKVIEAEGFMQVSYDIEKMKKAIHDFHNLTGISIAVYDTNFEPLIVDKSNQLSSFCELIQSSPEGLKRCIDSDHRLLKKCSQCSAAVTHSCHAGLTDVAIPIISNNIPLGFIVFGQVSEKENSPPHFFEIYEKVKELAPEYSSLKSAYESLTFFDRGKINSAAEIVSILTKYIWLENMIRLEFDGYFEKMLEYIKEHLSEPLTVSHICREFNVSKNTLYKDFHSHLGCTVNEYVKDMRLKQAEQLLISTRLPIYQICEQVGVNNYHYFCRLFKKKKSISPLQYRKQYKK